MYRARKSRCVYGWIDNEDGWMGGWVDINEWMDGWNKLKQNRWMEWMEWMDG